MDHDLDVCLKLIDIPISLLDLLSNTLILHQTAPYIPISSLFALGATSKAFKALIYTTPTVFRYLDLSQVKSAQPNQDGPSTAWLNAQAADDITADNYYSGPLKHVLLKLQQRNILQNVQTLVLDGLDVPASLINEIISNSQLNIKILSVRSVHRLNERHLQQVLGYAVRLSRPANMPKLQGLYLFGPKDVSTWTSFSRSSELRSALPPESHIPQPDRWFDKDGRIFPKVPDIEWPEIVQACQGIISFDLPLCNGPYHSNSAASTNCSSAKLDFYRPPRVATHALGPCSGCNRAPEGFLTLKKSSIEQFPLVAPPPLHSSTTRSARTPPDSGHDPVGKKLLMRCLGCLQNRYCESCYKWWCEDCYEPPVQRSRIPKEVEEWEKLAAKSTELDKHAKYGVIRDCFECGFNCIDCIGKTQLMCKLCGGGYCLTHNEGSTLTTCDWCGKTSGRRTRELY